MAHLRNYWTKPRKKSSRKRLIRPLSPKALQTSVLKAVRRCGRQACPRANARHKDLGACLDRYDSHQHRAAGADQPPVSPGNCFTVILAVSFCHGINDIMQSLLSAIYPLLKENYGLDFWQIGLLTFTFQVTASLLQPLIGMATDKRPMPYSLPYGMASSLIGLIVLAYAGHYALLLIGASLIGIGSAIFHPESSRIARSPPAAGSVSPSRCSRSAAISASRWGRCWPPSSSCPSARPASPGSPSVR